MDLDRALAIIAESDKKKEGDEKKVPKKAPFKKSVTKKPAAKKKA